MLSCRERLFAVVAGDAYGFGVEFLYFVDYAMALKGDLKFSLQGVNFGVFPPPLTPHLKAGIHPPLIFVLCS
ncbi:MAG: hypothetical protein ABWK05_03485 [Pyrobaculum sp.]